GVENVQVALAPDGAAKAQVYLGITQRRLTEIHLAEERGQPAAAATAATALASSVVQAEQHRRASTDQAEMDDLNARFAATLKATSLSLRIEAATAPGPASGSILGALDAVDQELKVVGASPVVSTSASRPTPTPTASSTATATAVAST